MLSKEVTDLLINQVFINLENIKTDPIKMLHKSSILLELINQLAKLALKQEDGPTDQSLI